jgi:hypothetical protein
MNVRKSFVPLFAILLVFVTAFAAVKPSKPKSPARYLYVWAGSGNDTTKGVDFILVLDANPSSKSYGAVIATIAVDSAGKMPHHTELVLPAKGPVFANDFSADRSFLIDFSDPKHPKALGRVDRLPTGHTLHSFARLPNGHVIATYQFGNDTAQKRPGGIAEFDSHGRLLRTSSARDADFPGAKIRPYGIAAVPELDRIVTTNSPMDTERLADVVQVWRISDLKLMKTLAVPVVAGDSTYRMPFELHALDDGSVLINTYSCGFYRLTNLGSQPQIMRVFAMSQPKNFGCSIELIAGKFMVMPIAYAHRYATLDISDPAHLREVSSLETDSTFFPHWISADPGSDRVVVTDQGDGAPMVMIAHLDRKTGRLTWDEKFRDPGAKKPGVSFMMRMLPNGFHGMVMPHGALFVQ